MRVVVDASVAVAWFLPETIERKVTATALPTRLREPDGVAVVPDIFHYEVAAILRKSLASKTLQRAQYDTALSVLRDISLETHGMQADVEALCFSSRAVRLPGTRLSLCRTRARRRRGACGARWRRVASGAGRQAKSDGRYRASRISTDVMDAATKIAALLTGALPVHAAIPNSWVTQPWPQCWRN